MSEKIDRRIGNNGLLVTIVVMALLLAAGAGTYVWLHMNDESQTPDVQEQSPSAQPVRADEPFMVNLFIPGNGVLSSAASPVKRQPDTQAQAREALSAALQDVRAAQAPVFKDLTLRSFFLDQSGTAYVDLSARQGGIKASAWDELLALYAFVDTLTQNFDEIKQVRFLVDGKEAQTLAGHIDLSRTFRKRIELAKQ